MPVSAVSSPGINAMIFPLLAELHILRKEIGIGKISSIHWIKRAGSPQIPGVLVLHEPADQVFETHPLLTIDSDSLVGHRHGAASMHNGHAACTEDDAVFPLTITDDDAFCTVCIFELDC